VLDAQELVLVLEFTDALYVVIKLGLVVRDLLLLSLLHLFHHLLARALEVVEDVLLLLVQLCDLVGGLQPVFIQDVLLLELFQILEHGPDHGFQIVALLALSGVGRGVGGGGVVDEHVVLGDVLVLLVYTVTFLHGQFGHEFVDFYPVGLLFRLELLAQQVDRVVPFFQLVPYFVDFVRMLLFVEG